MNRKSQHSLTQWRYRAFRQRSKVSQKFLGVTKSELRRSFHPSELPEILNAGSLQRQHYFGKIKTFDLRQFLRRTFVLFRLRPQPHAFSRRGSARAPGSLRRARAADLFNEQSVDAAVRIVSRHAGQAAVDDDADSIDRDRSLCNVGRNDNLQLIVTRDGRVLITRGQVTVQRQEKIALRLSRLPDGFNGAVDFISAGHEDQDV